MPENVLTDYGVRAVSGVSEFPPLPVLPPEAFPEKHRTVVEAFNRGLAEWYSRLNGRISLGDRVDAHAGHIDGEILEFTNPASTIDFPVPHHLGRVPIGVVQIRGEAGAVIRSSNLVSDTARQVWLRTTAAIGTKYRVLVF